jgi:homocitrate synthase
MFGEIRNVRIIDSTLREGEQFARAHFTTRQKLEIARALDAFGVEYLEHTSPIASPRSEHDLRAIIALGLNARVLTHTRCRLDDARRAIDCGVHGVNLLFSTSAVIRDASHRLTITEILDEAARVIALLREAGVEIRFSCEDAFRTDPADLLRIYTAIDALGVDRVGHNDGGCAIANAHAALEAGATHIDTTILGIGERNGIAPLSGLIARLYLSNPRSVARYNLALLPELDSLVAEILNIPIPFNACITSETAFTHKAGLHTNAVLRDPRAYESLDPTIFGRDRDVLLGHRLTGRNAIAHRARSLGIHLSHDELYQITQQIKARADERPLTDDEIDALILARGPSNATLTGMPLALPATQ